jgi:hypothetical protein
MKKAPTYFSVFPVKKKSKEILTKTKKKFLNYLLKIFHIYAKWRKKSEKQKKKKKKNQTKYVIL